MKKTDLMLMIDLETLGTKANSVVLSLGACFFDSERILKKDFYCEFDRECQSSKGRRMSPETFRWWSEQVTVMPGLEGANNHKNLQNFIDWVNVTQVEEDRDCKVWSNGASFDIPMIESMMETYNFTNTPWKFWNVRDVRTIVDIYPECKGEVVNDHNALRDAKNQATWIQKYLQDKVR